MKRGAGKRGSGEGRTGDNGRPDELPERRTPMPVLIRCVERPVLRT